MQVTQEQSFYLTSLKYTKKIINGNLNLHFFSVVLYITFFLPSYSDLGYDHYLHDACFHPEVQISRLLRKDERVVSKLSCQILHYYVSTHMKSLSSLDHTSDFLFSTQFPIYYFAGADRKLHLHGRVLYERNSDESQSCVAAEIKNLNILVLQYFWKNVCPGFGVVMVISVMFCVFVNSSCNFQAVKMDITEGGDDEAVTSSMVDDVFFIVQKAVRFVSGYNPKY